MIDRSGFWQFTTVLRVNDRWALAIDLLPDRCSHR
jgi:hypothetical protein